MDKGELLYLNVYQQEELKFVKSLGPLRCSAYHIYVLKLYLS